MPQSQLCNSEVLVLLQCALFFQIVTLPYTLTHGTCGDTAWAVVSALSAVTLCAALKVSGYNTCLILGTCMCSAQRRAAASAASSTQPRAGTQWEAVAGQDCVSQQCSLKRAVQFDTLPVCGLSPPDPAAGPLCAAIWPARRPRPALPRHKVSYQNPCSTLVATFNTGRWASSTIYHVAWHVRHTGPPKGSVGVCYPHLWLARLFARVKYSYECCTIQSDLKFQANTGHAYHLQLLL